MSPRVWFITGCSSGFGFSLARIALGNGHKVIASSRNPSKTPNLVKEIKEAGGEWVSLDLTSPDVESTIRQSEKIFGDIDVFVNSAGYSILGAVEDIDMEAARLQIETNYFGPLRTMQTIVPKMRARRSGTIVNFSSIAGLTANPSVSLYASSKYALEALSESLAGEMAHFNVRVLIVEPGAFRSNFLAPDNLNLAPISPPYQGTAVEQIMKMYGGMDGKQIGDVEKGCQRIYEVVMGEGMAKGKKEYLRLPLGMDCVQRARNKFDLLQETFKEMEEIAASTKVDE